MREHGWNFELIATKETVEGTSFLKENDFWWYYSEVLHSNADFIMFICYAIILIDENNLIQKHPVSFIYEELNTIASQKQKLAHLKTIYYWYYERGMYFHLRYKLIGFEIPEIEHFHIKICFQAAGSITFHLAQQYRNHMLFFNPCLLIKVYAVTC